MPPTENGLVLEGRDEALFRSELIRLAGRPEPP
jgi:hypothetical protein